jgi:hypothetical protein
LKVAIYTSIMGNFDSLKPQPVFPGVDYLCFTDLQINTPQISDLGWNIIPMRRQDENPRIAAKRAKITAHRMLDPNYDVSIWIDGSITIIAADFVERCLQGLSKWGIACMNHPVGRCIYQEAKGCADMEKYRSQRIIEQAMHYKMLGYPGDNGLAACGIIVRDMKSQIVKQIGDAWMYENLIWTYQDQISFPFVLWRAKHWFDVLSFDYRDRSVFQLTDHLRVG